MLNHSNINIVINNNVIPTIMNLCLLSAILKNSKKKKYDLNLKIITMFLKYKHDSIIILILFIIALIIVFYNINLTDEYQNSSTFTNVSNFSNFNDTNGSNTVNGDNSINSNLKNPCTDYLTDNEFFLEHMIPHHQVAVDMIFCPLPLLLISLSMAI